MPRPTITTTYTPRVKPTTDYSRPRQWGLMNLTCDTTLFTCDNTLITCDATQTWMPFIETWYTRPRKIAVLEFENWDLFELENWELLLAEWGLTSNIIQTIYT